MRTPKLWEWIVSVAIVALIGTVVFPIHACACGSPDTACLSNTKQIGRVVSLYSADNDESLPHRDHWMDSLAEYTREQAIFKHSQFSLVNEYGYAFDSRISARKDNSIAHRDQQPLVYDSINLGRNASDPYTSLPKPGRYDEKNSVAYLDGHAKRLRE